MRQLLAWLVTFRGTVTQGQYFGWGVGLVAAKAIVDALVCWLVIDQPWSPSLYFSPVPGELLRGDTGWRWLVLGMVALPFGLIGLAMSVRRLRDAGMPPWYAVLYVWPFANLFLFALLSMLPTRRKPRHDQGAEGVARGANGWASRGIWPALIASLGTSLFVWLGIGVLAHYGAALFLGIPFLQGLLVGVLAQRRDFWGASNLFFLSACFSTVLLLGFGFEGLLCIFMAAPLWIGMGLMGVALGRTLLHADYRHVAPALFVVPVAQCVEPLVEPACSPSPPQ